VGNISYDTTGDELETLFEKVGDVVKAEIVYHRRSNRSKGYAFVEMNDATDARKAAEALHDHDFMGRKIIVNGATSAGPQDNQSP
jgi:RNA recognition motif-containing protein